MADHTLVSHWFANGQFKGTCSCGARVAGSDRASAVSRHQRELDAEEAA